jgi:hypothetical protein
MTARAATASHFGFPSRDNLKKLGRKKKTVRIPDADGQNRSN